MQEVDFKDAFGKAAGALAMLGHMMISFHRDAEAEFSNPSADPDVKQAAKGAIVITQMLQSEITGILLSLREPLMAGAPEHLKEMLSRQLDNAESSLSAIVSSDRKVQ